MNSRKIFPFVTASFLLLLATSGLFNANTKDAKKNRLGSLVHNNNLIAANSSTYSLLTASQKEEKGKIFSQKNFHSSVKKLIKSSKQILIVASSSWKQNTAILSYYEKRKGKLIEVRGGIPVNLGRAGLGWGRGIIDFNMLEGPIKHEGDMRAPAGIFKLSSSFGYLPLDSLKWLNYPYSQSTVNSECVDDTSSEFYNTIVNTKTTAKTWKSSERMFSKGKHYKYGIIIGHNSNPPIPGCGSCIFFHVWDALGIPTAGCTVMSEEEIVKLLTWLDAKKNPILIQLPQKEFDKIRAIISLE